MTSTFTISLDFELRWGIRDTVGSEGYIDAVLGGRRAIPRILELFETFGIGATWATVGFLFARNKDDLIDYLPSELPTYSDPKLSPYEDIHTRVGKSEEADPLHFGLSLIERIQDRRRQEVGSHTFSHFYCLEKGGLPEYFAADMRAAQAIALARGIELKSLVLPRNQVNAAHIVAAGDSGIVVFRGNPRGKIYRPRPRMAESQALRAIRLTDSVLPIASTVNQPERNVGIGCFEAPASRFLRPVRSVTSVIATLQRCRIKSEMSTAARQGLNYHLWWHPHNMGRYTDANLEHLRRLLEHYRMLNDIYGMQSRTMHELACSGI